MWNVDPAILCRKHLAGEHFEMHMFAGAITKGKSIQGYIDKGLVEVHNIKSRHDELAQEMLKRGMNHNSPLDFDTDERKGEIDKAKALHDLISRCPGCREQHARLRRP